MNEKINSKNDIINNHEINQFETFQQKNEKCENNQNLNMELQEDEDKKNIHY